jgi:hypothetical protein
MPSAKDRAKATGDTHLPEIEPDELQARVPHPAAASMPGSRIRASWRNGPAELGEREAPTGDSQGDTREGQ